MTASDPIAPEGSGHPRRGLEGRPRGRLGLAVTAWGLAILTVSPMLLMVGGALKPGSELFDGPPIPTEPTLENFAYVLTEVPFVRYLGNSLLVATVSTAFGLLFHSMAGYALARLRFPGRAVVFYAFFATMLVSTPVILVPLFVVTRTLGLLDSYPGIILPAIFHVFAIFLLRQFYLSFPQELEDAARIDGCGHVRVWWNIVVPLSRPMLAALGIFLFLGAWNAFLWPLTITANSDLWVVQVGISNFQGEHAGSWGYILAASTIAALPTVGLFLVFQRQIIESLKMTGLK